MVEYSLKRRAGSQWTNLPWQFLNMFYAFKCVWFWLSWRVAQYQHHVSKSDPILAACPFCARKRAFLYTGNAMTNHSRLKLEKVKILQVSDFSIAFALTFVSYLCYRVLNCKLLHMGNVSNFKFYISVKEECSVWVLCLLGWIAASQKFSKHLVSFFHSGSLFLTFSFHLVDFSFIFYHIFLISSPLQIFILRNLISSENYFYSLGFCQILISTFDFQSIDITHFSY